MVDIEVDVFDRVARAVYAEHPTAYLSSSPVISPPCFPTVTVIETSNLPVPTTEDSSGVEKYSSLAYTVNVYSNSEGRAKQECRSIIGIVSDEMTRMNMRRDMCRPVDNTADPSIYRMVARYSVRADGNKTLYGA